MGESSGDRRPSGTIQVVAQSPRFIRTTMTGYFDDHVCKQLISLLDDWRGSRSGVTAFHDITGLEDYDVNARNAISHWTRSQVPYFENVHMLVERRTVAWALDIIIRVSGMRMTTYHSRPAFEDAYQRVVERAG